MTADPTAASGSSKGTRSSAGSSSAPARLAAFIPSLSRSRAISSDSQETPLSVNDQIAQSRRNAPSLPRARARGITGSATNASQQSTGLQYLTSSALKEEDARQRQRDALIKRSLAGPAPPSSWKADLLLRKAQNEASPDLCGRQNSVQLPRQDDRRPYMSAWRALSEEQKSSTGAATSSLRDSCLIRVADLIFAVEVAQSDTELSDDTVWDLIDSLPFLPPHLKLRLLLILGQEARANSVLTDTLLAYLFSSEADPSPDVIDASAQSDVGLDDWETEQDDGRPGAIPALSNISYLDLSFSIISRKSLTSLVSLQDISVNLRSLSLAGCHIVERGHPLLVELQQQPHPLVLTSTSLQHTLSQLINLASLSLAASHIEHLSEGNQGVFWRKFWASCPRLKVLDLSHVHGLAYSAFVSRYSGSLQQLLLENWLGDTDLNDVVATRQGDGRGPQVATYIGPWHEKAVRRRAERATTHGPPSASNVATQDNMHEAFPADTSLESSSHRWPTRVCPQTGRRISDNEQWLGALVDRLRRDAWCDVYI